MTTLLLNIFMEKNLTLVLKSRNEIFGLRLGITFLFSTLQIVQVMLRTYLCHFHTVYISCPGFHPFWSWAMLYSRKKGICALRVHFNSFMQVVLGSMNLYVSRQTLGSNVVSLLHPISNVRTKRQCILIIWIKVNIVFSFSSFWIYVLQTHRRVACMYFSLKIMHLFGNISFVLWSLNVLIKYALSCLCFVLFNFSFYCVFCTKKRIDVYLNIVIL